MAALLTACGGGGGDGDSGQTPGAASSWQQTERIRANHVYGADSFGNTVRLSRDGGTLAVAAYNDRSDATTINGDETDRDVYSVIGAGAIHVYVRGADGKLTRQAYLKPPGGNSLMAGNSARLGTDLAISADGNRIVAGATQARGARTDAGLADGEFGAGRVAVFDRDAKGQWTLTSWNAVPGGGQSDGLGGTIAMSGDGRWVVAGAVRRHYRDPASGGGTSNLRALAGGAYLFEVGDDGRLRDPVLMTAPWPMGSAFFGGSLGISPDGEWIVVGAPGESTHPVTGQPVGDPVKEKAQSTGSVHLYRRTGDGPPVFVRTLKSPAPQSLESFGRAIAFSADGSRFAVGADMGALVDTAAAAFMSLELFNPDSGSVYVYRREGADFVLEASLKPEREKTYDTRFGWQVALDASGSTLAVGMRIDTHARGAAQAGYRFQAGSVRMFNRDGQRWSAGATLRPPEVSKSAEFGFSVALSDDGRWLAAGAWNDATAGAGINPPPDGGGQQALAGGAAYLFRR